MHIIKRNGIIKEYQYHYHILVDIVCQDYFVVYYLVYYKPYIKVHFHFIHKYYKDTDLTLGKVHYKLLVLDFLLHLR
jgi:hypothetical protein